MPNLDEDLDERVIISPAVLRLLNNQVPQITELVLQFREGIENVEF
jgi:hypothetical protein